MNDHPTPMVSTDVSGCCGHRMNEHDKLGCTFGWVYSDEGMSLGPDGCLCAMRGVAWPSR